MRDRIIHGPSGTPLDFANPDAICEEIVKEILGRERRGEFRKSRTRPGELICELHQASADPSLVLVQNNRGLVHAAHWPHSGLAGTHEIAYRGMTPEHRRQAECWAQGGAKAGYAADLEVPSRNRLVISDVVIAGPALDMAVEVQRQYLAIPKAKSRNTKTRREGREPLWAVDRDNHPIFGQVPTIGLSAGSWSRVPPPEDVGVTGLRVVRAVRCQDLRNGTCPNRRYGCNEWHPDFEPMIGMSIAAVAEMFPAGQLVSMQHMRSDGKPTIQVVLLGSKQLYEELVGHSADVPLKLPAPPHVDGGRIACEWKPPWLPWISGPVVQLEFVDEMAVKPVSASDPMRCPRDGTFLLQLVPGQSYCPICWRREMNARGRSNYPIPA